jgi:uncharacterized protein YkwD
MTRKLAVTTTLIVCLVVCILVTLGRSASPTAADPQLDSEEQAFATLINNYRAQNGLGPLSIDWEMQASSDWMSADMGQNGYFDHTDSLGRDPWTRMCTFGYCYNTWKGENIAAGFATAQSVFTAWQNSPGHNANMLGANYTAMGISRVYAAGSIYGWYWTNDFGGVNSNATPPASTTPTDLPTFTPSPTASPTRSPSPTPTPPTMPTLPQPWVGVNVWGLAANDTGGYSCGSAGGNFTAFLDSTFSALQATHVNVVRFWAFQPYAMAVSDGHRDWTYIDLVMSKAQQYGIYLIPVLDNHWNDCSYWPVSLYPNGVSGQGYTVSNTAYATEFGSRYGANPAIYAIEVINEDRETAGRQAFKDDLKARVDAVKSQTSKPVGIGNDTDGTGSLNVGGVDMAYLDTYSYVGATIATSHDYQDWNTGLPGSPACLQNSICWQYHEAQSLSLPFYIGEVGTDTCDNATKASALRAKLQAAQAADIAGVIYWSFDIRTAPGNCGFEIGPGGLTLAAFSNFRTATPTPSGGPTSIPIPTLTSSPTRTPSPSPTRTPTPSPTRTPTPSHTPTPTPTPTSTPTPTPSPTHTPTPTPSPTHTPTPTPSPTRTPTPVSSSTPSPTPTSSDPGLPPPPASTNTPVQAPEVLTPTASGVATSTTTATPSVTIAPMNGDADCDGQINTQDVIRLLEAVGQAGPAGPSSCTPDLDVNCDGRVDAMDALTALRAIVQHDLVLPKGCPPIRA